MNNSKKDKQFGKKIFKLITLHLMINALTITLLQMAVEIWKYLKSKSRNPKINLFVGCSLHTLLLLMILK